MSQVCAAQMHSGMTRLRFSLVRALRSTHGPFCSGVGMCIPSSCSLTACRAASACVGVPDAGIAMSRTNCRRYVVPTSLVRDTVDVWQRAARTGLCARGWLLPRTKVLQQMPNSTSSKSGLRTSFVELHVACVDIVRAAPCGRRSIGQRIVVATRSSSLARRHGHNVHSVWPPTCCRVCTV